MTIGLSNLLSCPGLPSCLAISNPIPLLAPVTRATLARELSDIGSSVLKPVRYNIIIYVARDNIVSGENIDFLV
jgi:hypothetical protein